jgi:hypothetical protein
MYRGQWSLEISSGGWFSTAAPNASDSRSCLRKGIHRAGLHSCLWPGTSLAETREEKERDMSRDEKNARRLPLRLRAHSGVLPLRLSERNIASLEGGFTLLSAIRMPAYCALAARRVRGRVQLVKLASREARSFVAPIQRESSLNCLKLSKSVRGGGGPVNFLSKLPAFRLHPKMK